MESEKLALKLIYLYIVIMMISSGCSGSEDPAYVKTAAKISGNISYENRTFGAKGFTGKVKSPLRRAVVQIMTSSNEVIAETSTDADGNYSFSVNLIQNKSYYLRALARAESGLFVINDTANNVYAYRGADFTADKELKIDLYAADKSGEPFNIYSCIDNGFSYLQTLAEVKNLSTLKIVWEEDKTSTSVYDKTTNSIYLSAVIGADDDGWDDTVILHEFAHYVAFNYSKDDSPGFSHNYQSVIDKRQAWSEGWATYFALKVMAWRGEGSPQYYVDTTGEYLLGPQTVLISFEIETPSFPGTSIGDSNEISIASLLWNMSEHIKPTDGHLGIDSKLIWDVFHSYIPTRENVSFETFWDGWNSKGYQDANDLTPVLLKRDIEYWSDGYEPNNATTAATPYSSLATNGMHFTFYGGSDIDWVTFYAQSGTAYTIKTEKLNGADTKLELYSSTGLLLAANDNAGACIICVNPDDLASVLSFTPELSDNLFIKIYPSPAGIAQYGSFDLLVQ